jgi:hypothetical protein
VNGLGRMPSISVVLMAREEESRVVREWEAAIDAVAVQGELIVIGKCAAGSKRTRVLECAGVERGLALSVAAAYARGEVLVFVDAQRSCDVESLRELVWNFTESGVGAAFDSAASMSAIRRRLFCPIPEGTIWIDMYWRLCASMAGYRVVEVQMNSLAEQRGHAGVVQLCRLMPMALLPWRNPMWGEFVGRMVRRLALGR